MMMFGLMTSLKRSISLMSLVIWLAACSNNPPAPVINRLPPSKPSLPTKQVKPLANKPIYKAGDWRPDTYQVKKGDTLFSIGLEFGYDYKEVAQVNNIPAPYNIKVGQILKFNALQEKPALANNDGVVTTPLNTEVSSTAASATSPNAPAKRMLITEPKAIREPYSDDALKKPLPSAKPVVGKVPETINDKPIFDQSKEKPISATINKPDNKPEIPASSDELDWVWPTKGKVIAGFSEASNKGIDIAGSTGQEINAAAAGKVIYSGSDLRGYGKLVIIKHNANYLSVYAHNSQIVIKEGQHVTRGQKIAEMGSTDTETTKLHFEIRHQGKSVDPSKYLGIH